MPARKRSLRKMEKAEDGNTITIKARPNLFVALEGTARSSHLSDISTAFLGVTTPPSLSINFDAHHSFCSFN